MSAGTANFQLFLGDPEILSNTASETLTVDRSPCVVNLVTAAAESRTLARPTKAGAIVTLSARTIVTSCTITVTGGYNQNGDTSIVLSNAGEWVMLQSYETSTSGTFAWRMVSSYIISNHSGALNAVTLITTKTVSVTESGKTFYLTLAGGFTITLPLPALGLMYRFICAVAPTTAYIIVTNGGANLMYGMMEERAGTAGVAGAARDTFNFVANNAIIGDWVEFYSDGTNWYYHGMVDVAAGNTVAQT